MEEAVPFLPAVLDRSNAEEVHAEILRRLRSGGDPVVVDLAEVRRTDAFGAATLVEARREAALLGSRLVLQNVSDDVRRLLASLKLDLVVSAVDEPPARETLLERLGGWGIFVVKGGIHQANMHLDGLYLAFIAPFRRRGARFEHFVHQLNAIGTGSIGILVLISFLIGLIMALQSAYQLRQFGANIYVANLVGVTMTRELGPLLTAIILSARSGSSIAAELGTMVVTEEVDALRVMAIDPKRFLVAPRFAAMALALPCLAVIADVAGIAGGFTVGVLGLDIAPVHYINQTVKSLWMKDVVTGLVKSFVFANVIAVVSCNQGLSISGGPEEVGRATTRAVVWSIVFVILADFLFTSLFFLLD